MISFLSVKSSTNSISPAVGCSNKSLKSFVCRFFQHKLFFVFVLCAVSLVGWISLSAPAYAASVTLTWQRNQEPDIAGYKVFYGTQSRQYTNSFTIDDSATSPPEISYTINGLQEGVTYYFAVKAFDLAGQESEFSEEVSKYIAPLGLGLGAGTDDGTNGSWYTMQKWLEVGSTTVDHNWKEVSFAHNFQNPVIIVSPPSLNGSQPCVVRVRNVTGSSFEMKIQEWDYLDGIHIEETVSYMVVEAGTHVLPDGTVWEAGTYEASGGGSWTNVSFQSGFNNVPVVLQSIQTVNEEDAVIVRMRDLSINGFSSLLQEEQDYRDGHAVETVGYLAVDPESSDVLAKSLLCDHKFTAVSDTMSVQIRLEEEQSQDDETAHAKEQVGVVILGNHVFGQIQSSYGSDPVSLRIQKEAWTNLQASIADDSWYMTEDWIEVGSTFVDHNWKEIILDRDFRNPVVLVSPPTLNGSHPCVVRVRNVTSNSFEIRVEEWDYLDGRHAFEWVSYMVVEAGTYTFSDGTIWEAGKYEITGTKVPIKVNFSMLFSDTPAVFQTVQTYNDVNTVVVRQKDVTTGGFKGILQEQEGLNDGHGMETVGYLAVKSGGNAPAFASLLCKCSLSSITPDMYYLIKLEEEQSKDSEVAHTAEAVAVLNLGGKVFAQIQTYNGSDTVTLRLK